MMKISIIKTIWRRLRAMLWRLIQAQCVRWAREYSLETYSDHGQNRQSESQNNKYPYLSKS